MGSSGQERGRSARGDLMPIQGCLQEAHNDQVPPPPTPPPTQQPTHPPVAVQQRVPELVGREVEPLEELALGEGVQDVVSVPAAGRQYGGTLEQYMSVGGQ
jgi:hypothetical protein